MKVQYLVESDTEKGYCLPEELGDGNDFSKSTRACLAFQECDLQKQCLTIIAVLEREEKVYQLETVKTDGKVKLLYVETQWGNVFFKIKYNAITYVGENRSIPHKLNQLIPLDNTQLETLCKEKNFFFV